MHSSQRVLERLRAEYLEMPGLKLRSEQVQGPCGIEPTMCNCSWARSCGRIFCASNQTERTFG